MLSSPIGRLRFFFYSIAVALIELIAVIAAVAATIGLEGFVNSQPGSSRLGMAGACLVVLGLFAAVRANLAWRRGKDAAISKWTLVPYIILTGFAAVLQAGALMVDKFGAAGNHSAGSGLVSLSLLAIWGVICAAKPKGGSFDPDAFLDAEGFGGPWGGGARASAASVAPGAPVVPAPVAVVTRPTGPAGAVTFGKRGLS